VNRKSVLHPEFSLLTVTIGSTSEAKSPQKNIG